MNLKNRQVNNSSTSQYLRLVDENMSVSPFGQNSVSDRAYKRTERLALATYLITNHVSREEGLRISLRDKANSLLEVIATSQDLFRSADTLAPVLTNVRSILTLLDLLFVSNLISQINLNVLKQAYINFAGFLTSSVGSKRAESTHLEDIFAEIATRKSLVPEGSLKRVETKRNERGSSPKRSGGGVGTRCSSLSKTKPTKTSIKAKAISTNRRMVMLDMLAKTGKVTVKEVAKQIPDTSPKTLQRELMKLVEEGVLKKEGNKRWTAYTLVYN